MLVGGLRQLGKVRGGGGGSQGDSRVGGLHLEGCREGRDDKAVGGEEQQQWIVYVVRGSVKEDGLFRKKWCGGGRQVRWWRCCKVDVKY